MIKPMENNNTGILICCHMFFQAMADGFFMFLGWGKTHPEVYLSTEKVHSRHALNYCPFCGSDISSPPQED